jgi:hypothetical protein
LTRRAYSTQDCGAERKIRPRILTHQSMPVTVVAIPAVVV